MFGGTIIHNFSQAMAEWFFVVVQHSPHENFTFLVGPGFNSNEPLKNSSSCCKDTAG